MSKFLLSILFVLTTVRTLSQNTIQIYGGKDHDKYLGCLNCNKFDSKSIWNPYGTYGSKYNSDSIWNTYGTYGGAYSDYSPFNSYAADPPVLVDKDGSFYGYFTLNKYKDKRTNIKLASIICDNWELIKDEVSGWYDKLFGN